MDHGPVSDGAERLARDGAILQAEFERLSGIAGNRLDRGRLLVVIAAAGRADRHLPRSVPRLLHQIEGAGLGADLLLGCNSGFEPSRLLDVLSAMPGVELVAARCTKKGSDPAPVMGEDGSPMFLRRPDRPGHRVFVVRQAATEQARGKIRMLSDLFGWIVDSAGKGWEAPRYLLSCDSESEFTALAPFLNRYGDEPALARLIARLDADDTLQVVGARNRNTVFTGGDGGVLEPDPEQPIPAIQLAFNLLHTRARGFAGLCGSGILGRTPALAAAYATLCRLYPNTRIDDVQLTVLLRAAGLQVAVEPGVAVTNFCPRADEIDEGKAQSGRWLGGIKDIEVAYGREVVAPIATTAIGSIISGTIRFCHRDAWGTPGVAAKTTVVRQAIRLLFALRAYQRTYRQASIQRGDDPAAIGYWPSDVAR